MAALRAALGSVVEDTVGNVEKKQARTYEELQAEQAEADEARPPLPIVVMGLWSPYWAHSLMFLRSLRPWRCKHSVHKLWCLCSAISARVCTLDTVFAEVRWACLVSDNAWEGNSQLPAKLPKADRKSAGKSGHGLRRAHARRRAR